MYSTNNIGNWAGSNAGPFAFGVRAGPRSG